MKFEEWYDNLIDNSRVDENLLRHRQLLQKAYDNGYEKGYEKGYEQGYNDRDKRTVFIKNEKS